MALVDILGGELMLKREVTGISSFWVKAVGFPPPLVTFNKMDQSLFCCSAFLYLFSVCIFLPFLLKISSLMKSQHFVWLPLKTRLFFHNFLLASLSSHSLAHLYLFPLLTSDDAFHSRKEKLLSHYRRHLKWEEEECTTFASLNKWRGISCVRRNGA